MPSIIPISGFHRVEEALCDPWREGEHGRAVGPDADRKALQRQDFRGRNAIDDGEAVATAALSLDAGRRRRDSDFRSLPSVSARTLRDAGASAADGGSWINRTMESH